MQPRASIAVVAVAHRMAAPRTEPPDAIFDELVGHHLPIIEMLRTLRAERVGARLSLVVTPPLAAQLREKTIVRRLCERFGDLPSSAGEHLASAKITWDDIDHDVVGAWADLEQSGEIEILGSAATHALLPLLTDAPSAVAAQIAVGRSVHRSMFGHGPRGLWLPECAWSPELEPVLADQGVRFVVVEGVGLVRASPRPLHGLRAPVFTPAGIAVFGRDRAASEDLARGSPLGVAPTADDPDDRSPLVVAACEARAFGRDSGSALAALEQSLRAACADDAPHRFVTLANVLEDNPVAQCSLPAASSWHSSGTWEAFVGPANAWMLRHTRRACADMSELARAKLDAEGGILHALEQAARELLLLQASEWAGTASSEGAAHFRAHLARFRKLAAMIRAGEVDEAWVSDVARHDASPAEVDHRLWA